MGMNDILTVMCYSMCQAQKLVHAGRPLAVFHSVSLQCYQLTTQTLDIAYDTIGLQNATQPSHCMQSLPYCVQETPW